MALPALVGSPKQVQWAETIRQRTFQDRDSYGMDVLVQAEKVIDATWWIANNARSQTQLVAVPKTPAPHQLVGGPPKPVAPPYTPSLLAQPKAATLKLDCVVNGKTFTLEFAPEALSKLAKALRAFH